MRLVTRLTVAVVLMATATVAGAAPRRVPRAKPAASRPGPDLFGGYSYAHAGQARLNGWALAGTYPLRGDLRLVADLAGHFGSFAGADLSQLSLMAGARWTWRKHSVSPFAEGLLGVVRSNTTVPSASLSESATDGALAIGGGVDYRLAARWAARGLVQLRFVRGHGTWDADPRISLGVVYRFGPW